MRFVVGGRGRPPLRVSLLAVRPSDFTFDWLRASANTGPVPPDEPVTLASLRSPKLCVSFDKRKRLRCRRRFLPGWIAKKRKLTGSLIRRGSQNTSQSLWTAMAAGRGDGICRAWLGIAQESRRCVRP